MNSQMSNLDRQPSRKKRNNALYWLFAGCLVIVNCLACAGVLALTGGLALRREAIAEAEASQTALAFAATDTPSALVTQQFPPTPAIVQTVDPGQAPTTAFETGPSLNAPSPATATPEPEPILDLNPPSAIEQAPIPDLGYTYLDALMTADYPVLDYFESATRLGKYDLGARTVPANPYQIGDQQTFTTDDGQIEAELLAITEHAYFWFETGLRSNQSAITAAANRFEESYYPVVTGLFGQEWHPGVDNDPHFSILHFKGASNATELGYFDSGDEYPRSINDISNEQEMVYLNMDSLDVGEDLYFGTLVHELQHLIMWRNDPNEEAWLNEGLSQLTEIYVGLDTVDTAADFLDYPNIQLNTWDYEDEDAIFAHYGASFLFSLYFWEQLGDEAVASLARHPANGLAAVSALLAQYHPGVSLKQFVGQWAVANYLDDSSAGPQYHYEHAQLQRPNHAIEVGRSPFDTVNKINQLGTHYVELDLSGPTTISFAGDTVVELSSDPPRSGEQMWFVPPMDELDARLTASVDLSQLSQATLNFWAWYDLEEDFDFAYINISTDGGNSWELLVPDHVTPGEYGPALGGISHEELDNVQGWVPESISLDGYAGRPVLIQFEVLTDSALTGRGFALDDIEIPELGFLSGAEDGPDPFGWQASGFARVGWLLPQQWSLHLIQHGPTPQVTALTLNEANQGQWTVDLGVEGGVLVITAPTPFASTAAAYWLAVE
jgi:hypothetical protein